MSLLKSHGDGDDEHFYAVALQVAASEARQGHAKLAKEIRDLVESAKKRVAERAAGASILSLSQPSGEVADLLEPVDTDMGMGMGIRDLVFDPKLYDRIERVLHEQQNLTRLKENGLRPRQRLLFTGPPGCGKTMTASALATELGLALFVVRLDSLISRYLGESLSKLRLIFEAAERTRAVYLFDEFDSIGYTRQAGSDVGEMRRILNSYLVFIERLRGNSLIIAATNNGDRLDKALYRRFDDLIEFGLPDSDEVKKAITQRLDNVTTTRLGWGSILEAAKGLSFAEVTRACDESIKAMIIRDLPKISTDMLVSALRERRLFIEP